MLRSLKVIFLNGKLEERIKNTQVYYRERSSDARPAKLRERIGNALKEYKG